MANGDLWWLMIVNGIHPLVMSTVRELEHGPVEILTFPSYKMVMFQFVFCKRLPEGIHIESPLYPMIFHQITIISYQIHMKSPLKHHEITVFFQRVTTSQTIRRSDGIVSVSGRLRGASPGILGPRFGFLQDAGAPGGRPRPRRRDGDKNDLVERLKVWVGCFTKKEWTHDEKWWFNPGLIDVKCFCNM